jgi:multidrug efflux pump subunit AcrA (membrane-fusion protein)
LATKFDRYLRQAQRNSIVKHTSRKLTSAFGYSAWGFTGLGVVALGSAALFTPVLVGQQPAPPRGFASPPAAGGLAPTTGYEVPAPAPAVPGGYGAPAGSPVSSSQPGARRGEVFVPHGLVTVIDDIKVPAQDAGALTKLYVRGGELVKAAVILGEIDNRETLAKQRIAQGELDAAKAQADSTAEIEAAEKGRDVALTEYEQQKDIRARQPGAVSILELNRARFQWERSLAQISVANTEHRVAGLTAVMKQAQLDATAVELDRKRIQSPIQGQVVEVYKHEGEWVQPGDPVLRLVRLDKVRVEGFVYAAEASRNELEGKPVQVVVYLPGDKQVTVNGRVDYASPIIEGSGRNRQYRIWAEVENQFVDGHFLIQPGSSAELRIDLTAAKLPAAEREAPPDATPASAPASRPAAPALPNFGARAEEAPAAETATDNVAPATNVETLRPEQPAAEAAPSEAPAANSRPSLEAFPAPAAVAPAAAAPAAAAPATARPQPAPATSAAPRSATPNVAPASAAPRTVAPAARPAANTPPRPATSRPAIQGLTNPTPAGAVPPRTTPQR